MKWKVLGLSSSLKTAPNLDEVERFRTFVFNKTVPCLDEVEGFRTFVLTKTVPNLGWRGGFLDFRLYCPVLMGRGVYDFFLH